MTYLVYWKNKSTRKYKKLGIGFKDANYATMEAINIYRRGLDSKVKKNNRTVFDSTKI
jgi:hypothetical protein